METIGIDIGGTFTDFVYETAGGIRVLKVPTRPDDVAGAITEGMRLLSASAHAHVVHGTTVATNALLERKGARTALLTTDGFQDVLEIARQNRPELYGLDQSLPSPLVPTELRFGIPGRISGSGEEIESPVDEALEAVYDAIADTGVESVAVVLLFSFLNAEHEDHIQKALGDRLPDVDVTLSSRLLPEYREYERAATTVANAYLNPIVRRYLENVVHALDERRVSVMHSGAGVVDPERASQESVRLVLSGPAGGVVAAFKEAASSELVDGREEAAADGGRVRIISLDMGGTSADVCLCDGAIPLSPSGEVGGVPIRFPSVDIQTVGAGGGSIAWIDDGDVLRVGPQSAGAQPGPACYNRGGSEPTVTDANLVLGRLPESLDPGGEKSIVLDVERARAAIKSVAERLGMSIEETALGIVRLANASMERALRAVSVARGHDPREFTLVPFGGAGPLHACALGASLGIERMLVPRQPGVLSALGLCLADTVVDRSRGIVRSVEELVLGGAELETARQELEREIDAYFEATGGSHSTIWTADMRYRGQSYELNVEVPVLNAGFDLDSGVRAFERLHERRFGYALSGSTIELVTLRASGRVPAATRAGADQGAATGSDDGMSTGDVPAPHSIRAIWFDPAAPQETPVWNRSELPAKAVIEGPALFLQPDSTVLIEPGWTARIGSRGEILVIREAAHDAANSADHDS